MKNLFFALTFLAIGALGFSTIATADGDVKKELTAVYAKMDAAIKARDMKTVISYLGDDFEMTADGKTMKRAEAVAHMQKQMDTVKEFTMFKSTIEKIEHVEGNEIADVKQEGKFTAVINGKEHTVEAVAKVREWWIKTDEGKWLCIGSEELSGEIKIDGKPAQ